LTGILFHPATDGENVVGYKTEARPALGGSKNFLLPPGRLRNRGLSNEVREFHSGAMICLNAASATPQVGSPSVPRSRRASLCRTPDEANPEDEHADGQQYCADIGEIDEPVRGRGIGRQHG